MRNKQIFSKDLIFKMSYELRKQGKVVGLTHGAFDLFHTSHLDLLLQSAKMCDFLIVGVDSDESIKRYKDYYRPIIEEQNRLKIISELNCVDAVFVKDAYFLTDNHNQELYKEINPNFITIGQNYSREELIRENTAKTNIDLRKLDVYQNFTTTQIINRIIELHKKSQIKETIKK